MNEYRFVFKHAEDGEWLRCRTADFSTLDDAKNAAELLGYEMDATERLVLEQADEFGWAQVIEYWP